ncbi:MAG: MopE-related protein [Myxococcota bacterium]|nr:MopE-related protein [Myxococcota bacterium]
MLTLITLLGCSKDLDQDGYDDKNDCDDNNSAVYPGALEACNGIDDNCDGDTDGGAHDALDWFGDADGDGYGIADEYTEACEAPEGYVDNILDCDDTAATTYPEADELCDGEDNDCDDEIDEDDAVDSPTWYYDGDLDGFAADDKTIVTCNQPTGYLSESTDCDDSDAGVYPGAAEVCGDGVINDCEASVSSAVDTCGLGSEVNLTDARAFLVGEDRYGEAGFAVSQAGDFNGDGLGDIIIGAPYHDEASEDDGRAYIVFGDASGEVDLSTADATFTGFSGNDFAGYSVAGLGDWDGDGLDDVAIGANQAGVYVVAGGSSGDLVPSESYARLAGGNYAVGAAGDLDGDGLADLIAGNPYDDSNVSNGGIVYLVLGGISGNPSLGGSADAKLYGSEESGQSGWVVSGIGDFDGDGFDDIIIGAPYEDSPEDGTDNAGCVWIVSGDDREDADIADVMTARYCGSGDNEYLGWSVSGAGDIDDDGLDDAIFGAPGNTDAGGDAGAAFIAQGGEDGDFESDDAYATLLGTGGEAGSSVSEGGDVNGDGRADLLVGAPEEDDGGANSGTAYLILGGLSGTFDLANADTKLYGTQSNEYAGWSLSTAGDVNNDGLSDMLVGAYLNDEGGEEAGGAYVILAGGY